ncbi:MAG: polysaccharide biosynthesis/export family protein [Chitinophagaceae bacterium]|nr:polysaccharide biosynthesis/export family protein [Chitinophagaceae bacterium]
MNLIRTVFVLVLPLYLISCGTQQKLPNYLEKMTDSTANGEVVVPELRIQKNDLLSIQVYSASTKPEIDALYNMTTVSATGGPSGGFLVDAKGNIEYPRLGTFHVDGLTKDELAAQIRKRLTEPVELLSNPTVIIRFQNLKVTVMGEVGSQGVLNIPGERVTILEAVGLAGGVTEYGMKDEVKIIREIDGKRQIGTIDLSSDKMFESPYYNLMQNDVVLVSTSKKKAKKAEQDVVMQRVSFGLSLITAIALIYNIFR